MKLRLSYKNYFSALTPKQFDAVTTKFSGWLNAHGYADFAHVVGEASNRSDLKGTYRKMGTVLADGLSRKLDVLPADAWVGTTPKDLFFAPFQVFSERLATFRGRKIAYLEELGAAIEAAFGRPITLPEVGEVPVDAHIFEYGGMLASVSGDALDLTIPLNSQRRAERQTDANLHAALLFLRIARTGLLTGRGKLVKNLGPYESFKGGAVAVWPEHPHFINPLARMWRLACLYGLVVDPSEDLSCGMGAAVAHWMRPQFELAKIGGLQPRRLEKNMHRMNVCELIFGQGWLRGKMALHEGDEKFALTPGGRTRIIHNAQVMCDASLIAKGLDDFQACADEIDTVLHGCDDRGEVQLAAAIRANRKSMLATAIRFAEPREVLRGLIKQATYLCAVIDIAPMLLGSKTFNDMKRELAQRAIELRTAGDSSIADIVVWMAKLFSGQLTHFTRTAAERFRDREAWFRNRGNDVLAEMMGMLETLLVRSIAYAYEQGGEGELKTAVFAARVTRSLDDTLLTNTLTMKEGLVQLAEILESIPTMHEAIAEEIIRLELSGDELRSGVLAIIASAIVTRAIYKSQDEKFVQAVFERLSLLIEVAKGAGAESKADVSLLVRRAVDKDMSVAAFRKYVLEMDA